MGNKTFSIRLEDDILDEVRKIAEKERRATNAQIVVLLEKGLKRYKKEQEYLKGMSEEDDILPIKQTDKNVG
jgi:hypothetical protein